MKKINSKAVEEVFPYTAMIGFIGVMGVGVFVPLTNLSFLLGMILAPVLLTALFYPFANNPDYESFAGKVRYWFETLKLPMKWYTHYRWVAFCLVAYIPIWVTVAFALSVMELNFADDKMWEAVSWMALVFDLFLVLPMCLMVSRNRPGVFAVDVEEGKDYKVTLYPKVYQGRLNQVDGYDYLFWVKYPIHRADMSIDKVTNKDKSQVEISYLEGMTWEDKDNKTFLVRTAYNEWKWAKFYGFDKNHDAEFILLVRIPMRKVKWQVFEY